jgi:predicted secreted hydrolase
MELQIHRRPSVLSGAVGVVMVVCGLQLASGQNLIWPSDEGKHAGVAFESWMMLTHLTASDGGRFGLALFFFTGKVLGLDTSGVYLVVTDDTQRRFQRYKKLQIPVLQRATHTTGRLLERYGRNILRRNPPAGPYEVVLDVRDLHLSLALRPAKKPLDFGRVAVGRQRVNRLYAVPRGDVSAQMHYQGKDYVLTGIGMFQHQWGDFPAKEAISHMFILHMEDGTDVMISYSDTVPAINSMVLAEPQGQRLLVQDFEAKAEMMYTVPSTRDRFALRWTIVAPQHAISLSLTPTFDGQEVTMLGLSYWLARCEVVGNVAGRSVGGVGYIYIRRARGAPFEE